MEYVTHTSERAKKNKNAEQRKKKSLNIKMGNEQHQNYQFSQCKQFFYTKKNTHVLYSEIKDAIMRHHINEWAQQKKPLSTVASILFSI